MPPTIHEHIELVYTFIWEYVTEYEALPLLGQIATGTGLAQTRVSSCIACLRDDGRIAETTLMPTAYAAWWRENNRRDLTWRQPGDQRLKALTQTNVGAD